MSCDSQSNQLPEWVSQLSLKKAVRAQLGPYEKILSVNPSLEGMKTRNCTILLPIKVRVLSQDHSVKRASFMLKTRHSNNYQSKILGQFKMFHREQNMYHHILPKFSKLYKAVGKDITFGPRSYKLDNKIGVEYVLLEDLKVNNYKNVNRLVGFDLLHIRQVLKKLAELHAASARYVEQYGILDKLYTVGVYSQSNKCILKELNDSEAFLTQLKRWRGGMHFYKKVVNIDKVLVDRLIEDQTVKSSDFNVLNHSDCWINNVMFKYDGFGKIEDTKLLDYQVAKYGSPAYDLFFVILSSACKDIKLELFDDLVQFYFYYLLENLKLLNYQQPLPQLKTLKEALSSNGLAAYCVVSKVLPIVMLDKFEDEADDTYQSKMKCSMFTNRKYIQAMAEILPWLERHGYLDWKKKMTDCVRPVSSLKFAASPKADKTRGICKETVE